MDAETSIPDADRDLWFTPLRFGAILSVFLFAAFPRVLLGLEGFYYRDYGVLGYPFVFHAHESFWRGELPLWNPLSNCGAPFLAQWGTMALYPFSIVYLLFPLPWSLSYFCLGHLWLGGMGMYWLAQRWTSNRFGASLAGLCYVFNGVMFSCLLWPNYTVALGWMPWVVLAVERSWREGGRWLVTAALVSTMQMLSGVPEVLLLTWIFLGSLWATELARGETPRRSLMIRMGVTVFLVTGLMAAQLLPFFDLLAHSQRDRTFSNLKWAMPGWGWANLLVPIFHCFETYQGPFFQYGQEFMTSYYLGAAIFVLAIWSAWKIRHRHVWLLAASLIFSLILAMGESGVLFTLLKKFIPLMNIARFPIKFVLLSSFAVPLLAAYGVRELDKTSLSHARPSRSLICMTAGALCLMGVILWFARAYPFPLDQWQPTLRSGISRAAFLILIIGGLLTALRRHGRQRRLLELATLALIAVDAQTHTVRQNPTLPTEVFAPALWQQQSQRPPPSFGESRAMISPEAEKHLLRNTIRTPRDEWLGKRLALWSNLNLLDDIPKVNGSSTLQLKEQKQVEALLYTGTNNFGTGLVDFFAVSQITAPGSIVEWSARSNYCAMITCGQKPVFAAAEETLRALAAPEFDPRKVVYLPVEASSQVTVSNQTSARILTPSFSAHHASMEVEADAPSLVVVSQSFYHAWRARVDKRRVTLWRGNHGFQVVEVPSGRHHITLDYEDAKFFGGSTISGATMIVCLVLWRRNRKGSGVSSPKSDRPNRK